MDDHRGSRKVNNIIIPQPQLDEVINSIPHTWLPILQKNHLLPYMVYALPDINGIQLFCLDSEEEISQTCIYEPAIELQWIPCENTIVEKKSLREAEFLPTFYFLDTQEIIKERIFLGSYQLLSLSTKIIRKYLCKTFIIPSTIKWNTLAGKPVHWYNTFKHIWSNHTPLPWNQTLFNLIHQSFTLGSTTQYWNYNKASPFCDCDGASIENHEHLFWTCPISQTLWSLIWRIWHQRVGSSPPKTLHSILSLSFKPRSIAPLWIALVKCGLHCIWIHRCDHVYSQKNLSNLSLQSTFFHTFKTYLATIKKTHPKTFKTIQKTTLLSHPSLAL